MTQTEQELYDNITLKLDDFDEYLLPGIASDEAKNCFVRQIVDSIKRVRYYRIISERQSTIEVINPYNIGFSPILASVYHRQNGNLDEAFWLVFLATHFGKHATYEWGYVRGVYGKLNTGGLWSWENVTSNIENFRIWLHDNEPEIRDSGKFSNHRRYQSLSGLSQRGTGASVESYVNWIGENNSHQHFMENAINQVGDNPKILFRHLYRSMSQVMGFGRLGKFDFLTNIGKLGLVNIEPDSAYIANATGPKRGARLLFGTRTASNVEFEAMFQSLDSHLELDFGMQVLEDAVCNWQKDTINYSHFSG